jgi:hypothetical protein
MSDTNTDQGENDPNVVVKKEGDIVRAMSSSRSTQQVNITFSHTHQPSFVTIITLLL